MSRRLRIAITVCAAFLLLVASAGGYVWAQYRWTYEGTLEARVKLPAPTSSDKKLTPAARDKKLKAMEDKLASLEPKGVNVVIDTAANRLYLRQGTKVVREAVVSCGSGNILANPNGKEWVFDSPRGERTVKRKKTNPVWVKPDWAFVEEGKPIPAKNHPDRFEANVLGDYALDVGNGFLLHGTLYRRMLGRNVSHGCVRVGDDDLEALYKTVPEGAKVFFY